MTLTPAIEHSVKYRPEIDGLRAIAVLPVLFYHAGLSLFPGGFVGVDIFFVISGFLITSIIARDIGQGAFSFRQFYERRIRRIFPALFAVLLASTLAACVIFPPADFARYGKSLVAVMLFVSNIFFRREGGQDGYFDQSSEMQALLHTWSLSVEEQFYIFFPIALLLLHRFARGLKVAAVVAAIVLTFALSAWGVVHKPTGTFYLLLPRSWELLIGSLLAMQPMPVLHKRFWRELAAITGMAMIAWAVFMFDRETAFPGSSALFPCLGAWLIIYAGGCGSSSVRTLLSSAPLVFIGMISYSLYLWHWPIIVFSKYFAAGKLSDVETGLVILSSLIMAYLSFRYVEAPFRGSGSRVSRKQVFAFGLGANAAFGLVGLMVYMMQGIPARYDAPTLALVQKNLERKAERIATDSCRNWKTALNRYEDVSFCTIGHAQKNILFWGDSHAEQFYPLAAQLHAANELDNKGAVFALAMACPPTATMNSYKKGYHCDAFARYAMQRAKMEDIDTVVISFSTWWTSAEDAFCLIEDGHCGRRLSAGEMRRRFMDEMLERIGELKGMGKRVVIALPFPIYNKFIPALQIRNAVFSAYGGAGTAEEISPVDFREQLTQVVIAAGGELFDPRQSLCEGSQCTYQADGVSLYIDNNHIAASQMGILKSNLQAVMRRSVAQ